MPKADVKWKRKGHLAAGGDLQRLIQREVDPVLRRAALVLQGGIQEATPVRTGTLRRSMATSAPEWRGPVRRVRVGSNLVYARPVNVRGRSRGYFKRGIDAKKARALSVLRDGIPGFVKDLWVPE